MIFEVGEARINCAYGRILRPRVLEGLSSIGAPHKVDQYLGSCPTGAQATGQLPYTCQLIITLSTSSFHKAHEI